MGTLALQLTCIAGTHALQHTLGQMHGMLLDLYPDLQERGWDGTTFKWMLARASGQGDQPP